MRKSIIIYTTFITLLGTLSGMSQKIPPLKLPERLALKEERVSEITKELQARFMEDQKVRVDAAKRHQLAKVDRENTTWLRNLVKEIGWIDTGRFSAQASSHAFMILQHSGDLPFMLAALPLIEKDVRAKKLNPQAYALLYDRTQLKITGKQKYGTQFGMSGDKGTLIFAPLIDRDKIDTYRKAIGMMPLAQYLNMIRMALGKKELAVDFSKSDPPKSAESQKNK